MPTLKKVKVTWEAVHIDVWVDDLEDYDSEEAMLNCIAEAAEDDVPPYSRLNTRVSVEPIE